MLTLASGPSRPLLRPDAGLLRGARSWHIGGVRASGAKAGSNDQYEHRILICEALLEERPMGPNHSCSFL